MSQDFTMTKEERQMYLIRLLNDAFRTSLVGGKVMLTSGVQALADSDRDAVIEAVRRFNNFSAGDDPYGEHDFGRVEVAKDAYFWKIDYLDRSLEHASDDPACIEQTVRVLTIMACEEF